MGTTGIATTKLIASLIAPSTELLDANMITSVSSFPIVEEFMKVDDTANHLYTKDIKTISSSKLFIGNFETTSTISEFDKVINTLESYKFLEEDWDGYGGVTPSTEIVDTAINLIFKIKREDVPTPKPMVSSSGNIGLYWNGKASYIEIGIDDTNSYYTYISEGDKYAGQENNLLDEPLPNNLTSALENLSA